MLSKGFDWVLEQENVKGFANKRTRSRQRGTLVDVNLPKIQPPFETLSIDVSTRIFLRFITVNLGNTDHAKR